MKRLAGYAGLVILLTACGGDSSSGTGYVSKGGGTATPEPSPPPAPVVLHIDGADWNAPDETLARVIDAYNLTGNPAGTRQQIAPSQDPMVRLGQLLFFSKALSQDYDVACASCHHPTLGGGDALSLPVGVASYVQHQLGPGRQLDPLKDKSPLADGGPNVPRNSQTIVNAALYEKAMFWDGRVSVMEGVQAPPGTTVAIRTPESGNNPDPNAGGSLLEVQARFPVTSPDEMRGFGHPELITGVDIRDRIIQRFRFGDARMMPTDITRWLKRFREAFDAPDATTETLFTYENMQQALAAYQASQIFINTPWKSYVEGRPVSISEQAREGAMLFFLSEEQGGLGCVGCHSGDHFTNEQFYNAGFPQFGHGKRGDGRDFGRYDVTRQELDRYAFRVPSLINAAATGPWGHTGAFDTLGETIRYHVNPVDGVNQYDFSLASLQQFASLTVSYPNAEPYTREAVEADNIATPWLPQRFVTDDEIDALTAFLEALTDEKMLEVATTGSCQIAVGCPTLWTPERIETDGDGEHYYDGNMLEVGRASLYDSISLDPADPGYQEAFSLTLPSQPALTGFRELDSCSATPATSTNTGEPAFIERSASLGLTHSHGYSPLSWEMNNGIWTETLIMSGGITGGYLDDDCWPDLLLAGGDTSGLVLYSNQNGSGFQRDLRFPSGLGFDVSTVALVDLDGDYRREWIAGNTRNGVVVVVSWLDSFPYFEQLAMLPMTRNTFGIAAGDYNNDGYPDLYFGHWGVGGLPGTSPAFWRNDGGDTLRPADRQARLSASDGISQQFNFAPAFADFNGDGWQDLVVASDFGTSLVAQNADDGLGSRYFRHVTERGVITDENGMGQAVGDIDNDGKPDWFVSSVYDPNGAAEGNWGVTGNRLYRNVSTSTEVRFEDITEQAGVRNGLWGWGVCMADFNNDGWLDIFHENGFGYIPESVRTDKTAYRIDNYKSMAAEFIGNRPVMFINQGDGTFVDEAIDWGLEPSNGRGVVCFDHDRDGDIDIVTNDSSSTPKFYENQLGHGAGRAFVGIRLQGLAPNTDALGARVEVVADINGNGVIDAGETQIRTSEYNDNYVSHNPPDLHVGLGNAATIQSIRVVWPDGSVDASCTGQPVNRFMVFRQGQPACE